MSTQFLKQLKFLLTSTNQHGVHSPFVFDYLTKCLYHKKLDQSSKVSDILMKSIPYFGSTRLSIMEHGPLKENVGRHFPQTVFDRSPFDLIYVENIGHHSPTKLFAQENRHNDTVVLINSIHHDRTTEEIWERIVLDKRASVTIDFFHCGAVFFRKEQVKEHFKIRI